jgi:hypothetical protein
MKLIGCTVSTLLFCVAVFAQNKILPIKFDLEFNGVNLEKNHKFISKNKDTPSV